MSRRLFAWQVRMECDGRLGVERDVELSQLFVAAEVVADAAQYRFLLGVGEVETRNLFEALERIFAKSRRRASSAALRAWSSASLRARSSSARNVW